jgi:hypothetical protein
LPPMIRANTLARIIGKSQSESLIYLCCQTVVKCHWKMSTVLPQNNVLDGTDVLKDRVKKPSRRIPFTQRIGVHRISCTWMRCGLAASLTFLAILASILTRPVPGSAAEPLNETVVPPSPTTVQVTPPPKGTITSQPSSDATTMDTNQELVAAFCRRDSGLDSGEHYLIGFGGAPGTVRPTPKAPDSRALANIIRAAPQIRRWRSLFPP